MEIQNLKLKIKNWIVFGLFALMVFGKTLLFDHFAFREWGFEPAFIDYIYKIAAAVFFASFTFLLRDKR